MSSLPKNSAVWRQLGLSYLQYLGVCSRTLRGVLKEPFKSRALTREGMFYNKTVGTERTQVTSLFNKAK